MARQFGDLELGYVREVLESGRLGWHTGGLVTRFEEAFAQFVGAKFGIARNSNMTGLAQAVSISGAGVGAEVICDPIVHFGAVAALYFNAVPRFADVKYDTLLMDPESVRQNITERTKALIVTNLWGLCADLDELRRLCDAHGIFMVEDCAHNVGSSWKGRHAGTWGHVGVFSFQQGKHLPTGDGGMMVTDEEQIHYKLYHEWAFGGESPAFMTLNFRMNEVTAAIGLGQLQRVRDYVDEYNRNLAIADAGIQGCKWLRPRTVPPEAKQSGYIWACVWEGDRHGLDYDEFKRVCRELQAPVRFGFTQKPAYHYDLFKAPLLEDFPSEGFAPPLSPAGAGPYGVAQCPVRCPFYKSDYRYRPDLCPVAEDLIPRLVMMGVMEVPEAEMRRRVELLRQAIERMEG